MIYQELVRDFADRTRANLHTIENLRKGGEPVYEVTQLVNSMLGLLVFPEQQWIDRIPTTPLHELQRDGWPIPKVTGKFAQVTDLNMLIRYLRNAISHCNLRFIADAGNEITGLTVWNIPVSGRGNYNRRNWEAQLSVSDLRGITERFLALLLRESPNPALQPSAPRSPERQRYAQERSNNEGAS